MSKFLKFIVHLVVICAIVIALGLTIPPFFGVDTVVVTDSNQRTNLPMGSVTYAIPVKTEEIRENDPILVQEDSNTYRYNVRRIDQASGTGTVVDPSVTDGKEITVAVPDYVKKVVITIGYVGYLLIATKSTEGLIILGLVILFLIILYIIAELWKRDDRGYDDDDDSAAGYVKSAKELKREEKERARRMKEEEKQMEAEAKAGRKKKKAEKKKVRTGGFVDEIDEADDDYADASAETVPIQPAVGEAHEFLRKEVAAATATAAADSNTIQQEVLRVMNGGVDPQPQAQPAPQPRVTQAQPVEPAADESEEAVQIRKRAIPGYSVEELAGQAQQAGDTPDVMKDDITEVTLFDYSDILNEE